ncbi:MAG: T9SS type A sorting domain-containing protein [Acidobacteriota bacterium]
MSANNRKILLLISFLLIIPLSSLHPQFIHVKDNHFILNDKPYYFVGTNFWYGYYLGVPEPKEKRERLIRELDRLKSIGVDNLRILGGSEKSDIKNSIKPAIQISPGVYDTTLLAGLDFLLSEMKKRDMHAVVILNNYWEWSGGMAQYYSWNGGGRVLDPSVDDFGDFMNYSATFYRSKAAIQNFRNYLTSLINRKNIYTGLHYYEDPSIMSWELANEPRPGTDSQYISYYYEWIDSTANFIHSLDTNHLVTTGSEGTMGSIESESIYLRAHQSKFIDYITIHVWAKNWQWFDPKHYNETYQNALAKAIDYIQEHITLAGKLNKPLTMEEFGLPRDNELYTPGSATTVRDKYYGELLKLVYRSAKGGSPIAGSNFWGWGGEGRSPNSDFIWRVGDPFVCDPPMEPQGLNSVYDTDSSTIEVLRKNSLLMKSLRDSTTIKDSAGGYLLLQNYPNPFNSITMIRYSLPQPAHASLKVFDSLGREVRTLANSFTLSGPHEVIFNGAGLPSGVYYYRLSTENHEPETKKMMILR